MGFFPVNCGKKYFCIKKQRNNLFHKFIQLPEIEVLINFQGMYSIREQRNVVPTDFGIVSRRTHCNWKYENKVSISFKCSVR